jgi:hypothetical protein
MGWACRTHGKMRNAYQILLEILKGRDYLGDTRRWEDNIKTDFKEIVCEGKDWVYLVQDMD